MTSQKVSIPSENSQGACPGVLTGDVSNTKKGLIVLQEWWGLNQQIQEKAAELAEIGSLVSLVPDLYRGKVASSREEAGHYMSDLDWAGAVKDIRAAALYLKSIGCKKVGVTGFCLGGALSLAAAELVPEVDAAAPFYGIPSNSVADVSKIRIPIQCHFGEKDTVVGFSSPKDQEMLKEKLKRGGVDFEWHVYPAAHAFTNKSSDNYDKSCCDSAMKRLIEFMDKKLTYSAI